MDADDLYGLPLERFTEERNALVKQLRKEGRRDEAAEVSKLRKPSTAAWAVNQLMRTQRRDVSALLGAGDALRKSQSDLIAGAGEAGALRDAGEHERAARERLVETARGLLSAEGHELSSATLSKVSDTLDAAALDDGARAEVQRGCLVQELHHVGLGSLAAPPSRLRRNTKPGKTARNPEARKTKRETKPTAKTQQRSGAELSAARKAQTDAQRRAQQTARELAAARERRDRAAVELREAEAAVRGAQEARAAADKAAADAVHKVKNLRARQN